MASKYLITLFLLASLLLTTFSMAESRSHIGNLGFGKIHAPSVSCNTVYGTEKGDTCSDVAEKFGLSTDSFLAINPNINCVKIFVGQWLCIDGSMSSP